jgi:hypothetical protein
MASGAATPRPDFITLDIYRRDPVGSALMRFERCVQPAASLNPA